MKNVVRHIVTGTMMLLVLWCTSCSHDTETFGISDPETALSIGLRVPAKSPKTGEGYAIGETYENYIDVENNNYRIYFFTSDNKFIARFEPEGFVVTEGRITVCSARHPPLWPITKTSRWSCSPTGCNMATMR